MHEVSII